MAVSRQRTTVIVTGPYHSGKTTLVRRLFPSHEYVSLSDDREARELARTRPQDFFRRYAGDIVVDEFRLAPELSGVIRAASAGEARPGRFILLSSHRAPGSSIAPAPPDKLASVTLLPLTIGELTGSGIRLQRDGYIHRGFMPRVYGAAGGASGEQDAVWRSYYSLYLERCVMPIITTGCGDALKRFLALLAGRVGQAVNLSTYAAEVGVATSTLSSWVAALEANFVIFRLPCYGGGLGERIVRAPKLYFSDVGLAVHLLGIRNEAQLPRDPQVGNLFENMVVAEVLKSCRNRGKGGELYYFRNRGGLEIDLIVKNRADIVPIEIKCSAKFSSQYGKNIREFRKLSSNIGAGYIVYGGENRPGDGGSRFVNYKRSCELIN